jgi:hypothetical protein
MPQEYIFKDKENPLVIENKERLIEAYKGLIEDSAFSNPRTYVYSWDTNGAFNHLIRWIKENR